jgi:replicative DNA helicase
MNNESKLLNKIIEDKNLAEVLERGVTELWFADPTDKKLFLFLKDYFVKYQSTPSIDAIKDNFPTYKTFLEQGISVEDSLDYLIDDLVAKRRKKLISETIGKAIDSIDSSVPDHESALLALQRGILKLEEAGLNQTTDIEVRKAAKTAREEYEFRKNNPGLLGLPTGFPTMDKATSGLQPEQLIVIIAPPKTGKSTLALQIAISAHLQDKKPLFISFEMSNKEQLTRYYAMRARISHKRLMTGSLTDKEEANFNTVVRGIENMREELWFSGSPEGQTVSAIAGKIQSKNPDIVFIDGTYLMIDEQTGESNTPQAITNITRSLKRLARKTKLPIVISTQVLTWKMKGGNVSADSIGYSSSFHQDADVIFGLQRESENVDDTRLLRVVASRNGGLVDVSLVWDWETGQFRELNVEDL